MGVKMELGTILTLWFLGISILFIVWIELRVRYSRYRLRF